MSNLALKNILDDAVKLQEKIAVYIPATVDVNREIDNSAYVEQAMIMLSGLFGGATSTQVRGGWMANDNQLVTENTTIVYAYADAISADDLVRIKEFSEYIKIKLGQESVGLEYNHEFYLI